jgi:uncharacterized membrane protein YdjX (TVP38/TMEM64 family)
LLVALLTFATRFFPVVSLALDSSRWIGELGLMGLALLSLSLAIGSLCFLPASPFIIASAALFGFPLGLLGAFAGIALGASGGFLISRSFLREDVANQLRKHPTFHSIDIAVEREGWKIVTLLRLCPIPFGLANYLYGLTGVPFAQYLFASVVGSIPGVLLFCQLGSTGKASLEAVASGHLSGGAGQIAMLAISLLATISAIVLLPRFARRAVAKYAHVTIPSGAKSAQPSAVSQAPTGK